jgi:hypothetical protein
MYRANPIYDVVFRFMMEDEKVAKTFLSAIIREEVLELSFATQEHTARIRPERTEGKDREMTGFTVCRFDFAAKIATSDGSYKTVLIELQKAKLASDIMRFRRYLGINYQKPDNVYIDERGKERSRQIYCIFLLGYDIGILDCPVVEVDTQVKDAVTNVTFTSSNEFIRSLHHRSWIVQMVHLKRRRRNDLETLLSIFDQENRTQNHHILNIEEDSFPEIFRPVIRRLRMAAENEEMQGEMELEDDILKELQDNERVIQEQREALEKKDKALEEKDKLLEEQGKVIEALKRQLETNLLKNIEQR